MIRTVSPAATGGILSTPAGTFPDTRSLFPRTAAKENAYPSMAELSVAGISHGA
jgi:hypothetical protein